MVAGDVADANRVRCCANAEPARVVVPAIGVPRLSQAKTAIAIDYSDGDDCCHMAFHCV